ncbi:M20 family metallopeptidase [Paenibacillus donghaensis]|uniref:Probable succinyl-diaminopimelate desuccinylase n=1 Tax=Paenibacillus donghaensis TaxID=414771 RepID=A0A2Z2KC80_9BACL|nr:M20 family metallopeptidase [Paenibacillus donghaensis]ASA20590.1 hypothetical protein B9T62_07135 [Paenibacillus donghaensis]
MDKVMSREVAVPLLQRMIETDTCNPPGNEHALSLLLQEFLHGHGMDSEAVLLDAGRSNLEAVLRGSGRRKLMFCGHLDTVSAWTQTAGRYPPHGAVIEGSRLYGRGAADMKSGLAAMLLAMVSLRQEGIRLDGDLLWLATAGEEVDSCGARLYAEQHSLAGLDGIVIAEPTASRVAVGHKGALWLRISLHGRSAHGSMPQLGVNAVEGMVAVITLLHRHALKWQAQDAVLGASSLSVNHIAGGIQTNVVPDHCIIDVDIRTVPPLEHARLFAEIEQELAMITQLHAGYHYSVELLLDRSSVYSDPAGRLIQTALAITGESAEAARGVSYYTDGSVLHHGGKLPVLIYGPGEPAQAHQADEWVDIEAYLASIRFYRELALRFLGTVDV